ncbi:hypothetical protein [Bacillus sp. AFS040349]|uniref:hypothetical protein n=1 Tax=Bacillus sp. AFS040349 TaxID=2033502 RepID=UPI000BFCD565|nr:hypothetical protein [Bacillus sp. AFS040349]PGT78175.1 hypothetical protein COD11_23740 [Bacillus sp. AFS040349]
MRTLSQINNDYEEIIHGAAKEPYRSRKLADLMDEMEGTYKVPATRNEEWERRNKSIIAMYRKISLSRSL